MSETLEHATDRRGRKKGGTNSPPSAEKIIRLAMQAGFGIVNMTTDEAGAIKLELRKPAPAQAA